MRELTQRQYMALQDYIAVTNGNINKLVAYCDGLELAARIDVHLTCQTFHFHHIDGHLLTKFDEVIGAILAGELDEDVIPPITESGVRVGE